jgi:hypothetical protein
MNASHMSIPAGFIGLGNMGLPMAQNLLQAGHPLSVFNRTAARADGLCAQGATRAATPRALAEQHEIVLSIVADDTALRAIALGDTGVLAGLAPGKIHVDMSTVSPKSLTGTTGPKGRILLPRPFLVGLRPRLRPSCGFVRPVHPGRLSGVSPCLRSWARG